MNDYLEFTWQCLGSLDPSLCQAHAFVLGEHVALAAATVDENTLHTVLLQHGGICGNGFQVHVSVGVERSEWGIDKSDYLFHII